MTPVPTLADLCAQYHGDTLLGAAPTTRYHYAMFSTRLLRELGAVPLAHLTPARLRAWKQQLASRGLGAGTVNRYMKMLSAMLRVAVEDLGWLDVHPMAQIRKPPPPPGVVRFLSPEERRALLAACQASPHPSLYAIVLLALSTGGRKNEIRTLRWDAVDFALQQVRFLKTKTGVSRAVPLVGEALQVLRALWQQRAGLVPWVFPAGQGAKPVLIETAWRTARYESGVRTFRFHDLRHTYASYLAMSGASLQEIATLLGHAKIQMTLRYIHLMPSYTKRVVEKMAQQFLTC
jgi:integrase